MCVLAGTSVYDDEHNDERSWRQAAADERQQRKSDEDFKNKYPFNLFSFISCRLKTLMKQFLKLKCFILRKMIFLSYLADLLAHSETHSRATWLCLGCDAEAEVNDKLEEINFSFFQPFRLFFFWDWWVGKNFGTRDDKWRDETRWR